MWWVFWDILLPVAAAFLAGLFCGWLFWRWRRMRFSADELAAIRRSSARYKSDADTLRGHNAELSERLRSSMCATEPNAQNSELASANERIEKLRGELKQARRDLSHFQRNTESNLDRNLPIQSNSRSPLPNRQREMEAQAVVRQPAHYANDKAHAQLTGRQEIRVTRDSGEIDYLEAIADRDKMISTLKHSLEQYGEQQDTTALTAELALREQKIAALEDLLSNAQRVA